MRRSVAIGLRWANVCGNTSLQTSSSPHEQWSAECVLRPGVLEEIRGALTVKPGEVPGESASAARDALVASGILRDEEELRSGVEAARKEWVAKNWNAAFDYHLATLLLRKFDYGTDPHGLADKELMHSFLNEGDVPSAYKDYPEAPEIPLAREPQSDLPITAAFECEADCFNSPTETTRDCIQELLLHCVGQTAVRKLPLTGSHVAKVVPSGGSRHPIECYLVADLVVGVPRALYHYSVRNHSLQPLAGVIPEGWVQKFLLADLSRLGFAPKAALVFTAIYERSMHRYREPRSYKVIQYDLGHVLQSASFAAKSLGLNVYRGYSLRDSKVEELLAIDGINESAIAFMLIG